MPDINELRKALTELNTLRDQLNKDPLGEKGLGRGVKSLKAMTREIENMKVQLKEFDEGVGGLTQTINAMLVEYGKGETMQGRYIKTLNKTKNISQKLADDMKGISELKGKEVRLIVKQAKLELERRNQLVRELEVKKDLTDEESKLLEEMQEGLDVQKETVKIANDRLEKEKKIEKALGLSGAAMKGIQGALGKIGIESSFFEGVNSDMREAAKSGSSFKAAFVGIKGLASGLADALTDPVVIMGLLVKSFTSLLALGQKFAKYTADIGKAFLGMDASSKAVADNLKNMASKDMFLNFEEAKKALIGINAVAGTAINVSEKQVKTYQEYSHFLGLSEEATQGLLKTSTLAGGSFENIAGELTGIVDGLNQSAGLSLNVNDVIESVANASAKMRTNIGQSPKALAQAAFEAKKLGMTMDQIAAAGEANLDFQSSIEKEMMAEILLGKDLNLETLRLASLQGNEIVVAKEMNRLLADNFDKTKGNKISQQALADLLGVSVDEMHEMNQTRLLQNKLSAFGAEDRIKAEKEVNRLVSKGMTQEAALKAIADGKLETSIAAGKEAEASARILENAKETLMVNIAPLAEKISKFIAKIAESKELGFIMDKLGSLFKMIADNPLKSLGIIGGIGLGLKVLKGGKLGSSGNPMFVTFSKGGGLFDRIKNMISPKNKALKAAQKKLSPKQIAAGFGGKEAKDQLAKQSLKSSSKIGAKLGVKTIGKSLLKKIPVIGLLAGIGFGLQRAMKGDLTGAALEFASGAASTIPGLGTAASVAIDAGLAVKDYKGATGGDTAADFISRPGQPIQKFRADDVIVGGTNLGGGGSKNVEALLQRILIAIEKGGDVFMDGNKVGKSLALATSNMG